MQDSNNVSDAKLSLLIIDDHPDVIQVLSTLLHAKGDIRFATQGDQGLALAEKFQPDLILLDMAMPGMSGLEVCRRLRNNPETEHIRVIFITAHSDAQTEVGAFEAGAVDFINKPFNPVVVEARVETHLSLIRQSRTLNRLANHDGLTGLYNRRYLDQQLDLEFRRHVRQELPLGFALIDIDYFKAYNDGYGHLRGDDCLAKVAGALASGIRRPGEVVARYGGEEFAIILPHTGRDLLDSGGQWLCDCIRHLQIPHEYSRCAPHVTISVGLAGFEFGHPASVKELIQLADEALYEAKARGRNAYYVASKPLSSAAS
ncbi:MAG: diguanylate cyclase [Marinobacter sp.]|nr:diguanylate cyclase [Marinobacter sp.]